MSGGSEWGRSAGSLRSGVEAPERGADVVGLELEVVLMLPPLEGGANLISVEMKTGNDIDAFEELNGIYGECGAPSRTTAANAATKTYLYNGNTKFISIVDRD